MALAAVDGEVAESAQSQMLGTQVVAPEGPDESLAGDVEETLDLVPDIETTEQSEAAGDALVWTVASAGEPVGGASFSLWGPYASEDGWGAATNATDCTSEPCDSYDRDPAPGAFRVETGVQGEQIDSDARYRIQAQDPPSELEFAVPGVTGEIEGVDQNSSIPADGQWDNGVHDFGTFEARASRYSPVCGSGYVYGVSSRGQLMQVAPSGQMTTMGQEIPDSMSAINGLGVGGDGQSVYAFRRGGDGDQMWAEVYRFDTESGAWSYTGARENNTGTNLVAGAVRLSDNRYFFGGFNIDGTQFGILMYDPVSNTITKKGYIDVSGYATDSPNGDMAFDSGGNLYVVESDANITVLYSVAAQDLIDTWGGTIPSSVSEPATGVLSAVNGAALTAGGGLVLSNTKDAVLYDMPMINNGKQVTSSLLTSTDLASCDSPRTITIEKDLPMGRVNDSDQFRLRLFEGSTQISQITTQGTSPGVQVQRIGPMPVSTDRTLSFSEDFIGGDEAKYDSRWECKLDGIPTTNGAGTSGTWDIVTDAQDVVCRFVNVPLTAYVNVTTVVQDASGQEITDPDIKAGWEFTLQTTQSVVDQEIKTTDSSGVLDWTVQAYPDAPANGFPTTLRETQRPGYRLAEESQCTRTNSLGAESEPFPAAFGTIVLKPGDRLNCTFINRRVGTLTVNKDVSTVYGWMAPSQDYFDLTATSDEGDVLSFPDPDVAQPVQPGTYQIGEADRPGYRQTGITCQKDGGEEFELVDGNLEVEPTDGAVVCTVHNEDLPGSVSWVKTGPDGEQLLAGSEWLFEVPHGGEYQVVTDCVAETAEECAGPDLDPAAGKFRVVGFHDEVQPSLHWMSYRLTETAAPAGYQINPDNVGMTLTVAPENLDVTVDTAPNYPRSGPTLPMTGGASSDLYLVMGWLIGGLGLVSWAWLNRRKLGAGR